MLKRLSEFIWYHAIWYKEKGMYVAEKNTETLPMSFTLSYDDI